MEQLIQDFITWLGAIPPLWAYSVLIGIAYLEHLIPPIPGDVILIFGGYLAGLGQLQLGPIILLTTLSSGAGFMSMYAIGAWFGKREVVGRQRRSWITIRQLARVHRWLRHWGWWLILANRFLSGMRSVIAFAAGMARLDPWKSLVCSLISSLVWITLITAAGYAVGENWQRVHTWLQRYGYAVLALVIAVLLFKLYRHLRTVKA